MYSHKKTTHKKISKNNIPHDILNFFLRMERYQERFQWVYICLSKKKNLIYNKCSKNTTKEKVSNNLIIHHNHFECLRQFVLVHISHTQQPNDLNLDTIFFRREYIRHEIDFRCHFNYKDIRGRRNNIKK